MNPYNMLHIEPGVIPTEIIDVFFSLKDNRYVPASQGVGGSIVNDYRVADHIELPADVHENTIGTIGRIHEVILKDVFNTTLKSVSDIQFLKYGVGGKYDVHADGEIFEDGKFKRAVNRDISIVLYLNDNYEGGSIEFPLLGVTVKPQAGMMLAFPSYHEFSHIVHPVTSGDRYCLVCWIETENKIYEREDS